MDKMMGGISIYCHNGEIGIGFIIVSDACYSLNIWPGLFRRFPSLTPLSLLIINPGSYIEGWGSLFCNAPYCLWAEKRATESLIPMSETEHLPYGCEVRQRSHFISILVTFWCLELCRIISRITPNEYSIHNQNIDFIADINNNSLGYCLQKYFYLNGLIMPLIYS